MRFKFQNLLTVVSGVVLLTAVTQSAVLADGLNLTEPNSSPCGSQSNSQGFGLTNENVCSDKVSLENETGIDIYYDIGSHEDQILGQNTTATWTLSGSDRSRRTVVIDGNINVPGIQFERYWVYSGNNYVFRLEGNRIVLYQDQQR